MFSTAQHGRHHGLHLINIRRVTHAGRGGLFDLGSKTNNNIKELPFKIWQLGEESLQLVCVNKNYWWVMWKSERQFSPLFNRADRDYDTGNCQSKQKIRAKECHVFPTDRCKYIELLSLIDWVSAPSHAEQSGTWASLRRSLEHHISDRAAFRTDSSIRGLNRDTFQTALASPLSDTVRRSMYSCESRGDCRVKAKKE